jgi:hypothetical protein
MLVQFGGQTAQPGSSSGFPKTPPAVVQTRPGTSKLPNRQTDTSKNVDEQEENRIHPFLGGRARVAVVKGQSHRSQKAAASSIASVNTVD